ncbi:hypothetical protein HWA77_19230 [Photobacterium damselae subsp. damselae]|uniref:Uncharacterized protein n=1 Tax=Photobacterium damselae subsp. damselae TaxID=85581 RepID=A0A850QW85_PHODD|nr:hypothetical protein [Photobacterium damselae subsp. damselae]
MRFNLIIVFFLFFHSLISKSAESEKNILFLIKAKITSEVLDFKIKSLKSNPKYLVTEYNSKDEVFNSSTFDIIAVSNIPKVRSETFVYDLSLVKNQAYCKYLDSSFSKIDAPSIFVSNSLGLYDELLITNPIRGLKLDSYVSGFKANSTSAYLEYKKIPSKDFFNHIKYCYGVISLSAGLSL